MFIATGKLWFVLVLFVITLLSGFGFVKRALARSRVAAIVVRVGSAMVVAGLRPAATSVLILVGAHSDHLQASILGLFLTLLLVRRQRPDNRVRVDLEFYSRRLEGQCHHGKGPEAVWVVRHS